MTTPRYAAIYCRVSTEDQAKNFSIPTQIDACQKLAEREGYAVPETHLLIDGGISGTTLDRPALRRLRELIKARAIVALIVYDLDRLSRNQGHLCLLVEELQQSGVRLFGPTGPIENTPEGMFLLQIQGAAAQFVRAKLMQKTHEARITRAQRGYPWGGQVPLGYRAVREPHQARWEIVEEEAALVRRMFAMCLSGMTTYWIALQLSRERILTRGNGRRILQPGIWQASSVHRILTNEAYAGRTYWNKYERTSKTTRRLRPREDWIAIMIPAILDDATFHAAQQQLQRNRELSPRNKKRDYLLGGGRLRCGRCGRAMTGGAYRNTRRYHCSSVSQVLDPDGRCYGQVKADDAEPQVWAAVVRVLEQPELIAAEVRRQQDTADDQRAEIAREMSLIEAALAKCDRESQRWADAYAAEVINLTELKTYRADIEARRQSLLVEHTNSQAKLDAIGRAVGLVEVLIDYCARVRQRLQTFDEAEKRLALAALDIRATWTPGQPLAIQGSIPLDEAVPIAS
jgi:site-specific DNA recombinase